VQAPHSYGDKHTRRLALRFFEEWPIAAAAWNTVRRDVVDAAHHRETYVCAFTRAFMRAQTKHAIVQLHGFAKEKRRTREGRDSDIVVSNGTRFPGRMAQAVASELSKSLNASVKLYPSQVSELGGITNSQARIVHEHGFDTFLHIELSRELRENLRYKRIDRDRFNAHLTSSLEGLLTGG
jgi:hypothetical protein